MQKFEHQKERELFVSKIEFFTTIAHEIRTPLSLIKGPLENILSSENLSEDIREDMNVMNMNTNRLLSLINQLLDFRKSETQGYKLNFMMCDISQMVHTACKRFLHQANANKLSFETDIDDNITASVDREALTKTIDNLLNNSLKYAKTYVKVILKIQGDNFRLEIANDGIIIPLEMRQKIFEPFVQYKEDDSDTHTGTGIGLALSRSLVELHEGTLEMDTDVSCNRFIILMPLSHDNTIGLSIYEEEGDQPGGSVDNSGEMEEDELSNKKGTTILVVEDNEEMLRFIERCLVPYYNVLTAHNGRKAQSVLERNVVNLIVSDLMMPEMDGLQLCQWVKTTDDYSHIPFIILSAKTTVKSKLMGLDCGAEAYIDKPFSPQFLLATIRNILKNRENLFNTFKHSAVLHSDAMAVSKADENFLKKLNEVIAQNMDNSEFSLEDMANELNMSRTSLNRKIKGLFDLSPIDYLRLERLKKAAQLFEAGFTKVNEVCYMVGFNSPSYFTKCYQKQFGVTPKECIKH